jgi:hypothetical protein
MCENRVYSKNCKYGQLGKINVGRAHMIKRDWNYEDQYVA